MIPKRLHMIWVGNESLCPHEWIATWRDNHPGWRFRLWGNEELRTFPWRLKKQIDKLADKRKWHGVSDLMRYEILARFGGVYADADSECTQPLDDLLNNEAFVAWESETNAPGIIGSSIIGAEPRHPVMMHLVATMAARRNPLRSGRWSIKEFQRRREPVWMAVGPMALTSAIDRCGGVTVLPSSAFYPFFHDGTHSSENGKCYARQHWGSTTGSYRTGGYVGQPAVPVNHWQQMEALERALARARMANEEQDHINALQAAWHSISSKANAL